MVHRERAKQHQFWHVHGNYTLESSFNRWCLSWMHQMIVVLELFVVEFWILHRPERCLRKRSSSSFWMKPMLWPMMLKMRCDEVNRNSINELIALLPWHCFRNASFHWFSDWKVHRQCSILHHLQLFEQNHTGTPISLHTVSFRSIEWRADFATIAICYRSRKVFVILENLTEIFFD